MAELTIKATDLLSDTAIRYLRVLLLCAKNTSACAEVRARLVSLDLFMQGQCSLQQALLKVPEDHTPVSHLNSPLAVAFLKGAINYLQAQSTQVTPLTSYLSSLLEIERASDMMKTDNTGFTRTITSITLACAQKLAQQAEIKARQLNVPVTVAVMDASCNLVLHQRMEDALQTSIHVALNKAYSAVSFKVPTYQLAELVQPGAELYGIQHNDPRLVVFGGGFPIWLDGKLVGGLGVAGGTVAQDMQVARFALKQVLSIEI